MRNCKITGCGNAVAGYSTYCSSHAKTKARHGHPLQKPINRRDLKPFESRIDNWLDTRASSDARPILFDLWGKMHTDARTYRDRCGHGRPFQRNHLQAAETIIRVGREEQREKAIVRLLAMGYLRQFDPRRFHDAKAFGFQCARQVRSLTDSSVGIYWDSVAQRPKRVYRDVSPKTLRALAGMVYATGLTTYGAQIGEADLKERELAQHTPERIVRALLGASAADGPSREAFL